MIIKNIVYEDGESTHEPTKIETLEIEETFNELWNMEDEEIEDIFINAFGIDCDTAEVVAEEDSELSVDYQAGNTIGHVLAKRDENYFKHITTDEFDEELTDMLSKMTASELLSVPGIYEILAEHFNNDVIDRINEREGR